MSGALARLENSSNRQFKNFSGSTILFVTDIDSKWIRFSSKSLNLTYH